MTISVPADVISRLKAVLGEGGWSQDAERIAPKLVEWRGRWTGATPLLVLPKTTAEVAAVVGICAESGTAITPEYIKEHNLQPDYAHYITNQIMKPLQQLFALILEDIPGFNKQVYAELSKDKEDKKVEIVRNKEVKKLVFSEFI